MKPRRCGPSIALAVLFALIVGLLLSRPLLAADLLVSRAILEDPSAQWQITDVLDRPFSPAAPTLYAGHTDSAYWLKLVVRPPDHGDQAVLLIRQPNLNDVRLYRADAATPARLWPQRVTGNAHPYAESERVGSALGFSIRPDAPQTTYYLRVQSRNLLQVTVEALDMANAAERIRQFDVLETFFATAMLALLAYAVQIYLLDRQPVAAAFALHQAVYTLYGSSEMGYLAPLLPETWSNCADTLLIATYCATAFTTLLFARVLFSSYAPPKALRQFHDALLLMFPLQLALLALGFPTLARFSNFLLVRVLVWFLFVTACCLRQEAMPRRNVLRLAFFCIAALFTSFWLSYGGPLSGARDYLYGRQLLIANGLVMGIVFAMVTLAYSRHAIAAARASSASLALAEKMLELERQRKHEAEVMARTDYLTGLFNRRHFVERAAHELERAQRYRRTLSLLMIDVDHFKRVNDNWGHAVGDRVLRMVAMQMQETLRTVDLIARTGGEEFAALLPETGRTEALEVAERLRLAVAAAQTRGEHGEPIRVTVSLGVAELGDSDGGLERLMRQADRALYRAKHEGRDRVCS